MAAVALLQQLVYDDDDDDDDDRDVYSGQSGQALLIYRTVMTPALAFVRLQYSLVSIVIVESSMSHR